MLTFREWQGLTTENLVVSKLRTLPIREEDIIHNPLDPYNWKRKIGIGADIHVFIHDAHFAIEVKSNSAPVYPSYVERDYIPRFKDYETTHRFVVTDNINWFSLDVRKLLFDNRICLVSIEQLLNILKQYLGVTSKYRIIGKRSKNSVGYPCLIRLMKYKIRSNMIIIHEIVSHNGIRTLLSCIESCLLKFIPYSVFADRECF